MDHLLARFLGMLYLKEIALPFAVLLVGLLGLSTDPKERRKALGAAIALIVVTVFSIFVAMAETQEHINQSVEHVQERNWLRERIASLTTAVEQGFARLHNLMHGYGVNAPESLTAGDIERINAVQSTLAQLRAPPAGTHPIKTEVVYYKKDVDPEGLAQALRAKGLSVREGVPRNEFVTNALWVGDQVPPEDIRAAALTLMGANIRLHSIERFRFPTGESPKSHVVQVGHSPAAEKLPELTVDDVLAIQSIDALKRDVP